MTIPNQLRRLCGVGLFCGLGLAAQAQNPVTFSVDMSSQTAAVDVFVKGSFDSWGAGQQLFNSGGGVYTGTVDIASSPGTVIACKFMYNPGGVWEGGADRQFQVAGGPQALPLTSWDVKDWPVPVNNIKFQIDMTAQVLLGKFDPTTGYVRVSGGFNGWGSSLDFTNDPAASGSATNIYSETIEVAGFPGGTSNYKFRAPIGDTWETFSPDRTLTIVGGDQVLPIVYWDNVAPATPTNGAVVFQVDMSPQVLTGGFINGTHEVRVSGGFNGWGNGDLLTNNPNATGLESNVYSATIPFNDFPNTAYRYKFRANGGWESAAIYGVGNNLDREFRLVGGDQVLPLVTYSDASLCDLLLVETATTFVLHITNGTTAIDGTIFTNVPDTDPAHVAIVINGEFLAWQGWNIFLPHLTNNPPGSDFYEYTHLLPAGSPRAQKFKFGLIGPTTSGADNEAPQFADHIQYVRSTGPAYKMSPVEFGTNYAATRVEAAFGNLQVGTPAGGNIPVTWLGGPCVTLQTTTNVSGPWTDLPTTDATFSTNWPNAGGQQYFRLQKRPLP